jgi:hypothetical protein
MLDDNPDGADHGPTLLGQRDRLPVLRAGVGGAQQQQQQGEGWRRCTSPHARGRCAAVSEAGAAASGSRRWGPRGRCSKQQQQLPRPVRAEHQARGRSARQPRLASAGSQRGPGVPLCRGKGGKKGGSPGGIHPRACSTPTGGCTQRQSVCVLAWAWQRDVHVHGGQAAACNDGSMLALAQQGRRLRDTAACNGGGARGSSTHHSRGWALVHMHAQTVWKDKHSQPCAC